MEEELLEEILASYRGDRGELVPILQEVQDNLGYLPEKSMVDIAKFIGVPESHVYSVASFYAQFRLLPLGRKRIAVCRGTACHIRGAPQILNRIEKTIGLKEGETSDDLEYTLETVACFGCCALAPCIRVNMDVVGEMTSEKVDELFPPVIEGVKNDQ
ncbi:MAG: NADH-quinone oxidoreductase subunit NuoE [Thermodesulfovibrionales bacterium]|nr:NADH-quinone oxidoreductase subunit NuoE [Thermodesulfovibrionales bacterium]